MQRHTRRVGLKRLPVEVVADLDGPAPGAHTLRRVPTQRHGHQADQVETSLSSASETTPDLGFMARLDDACWEPGSGTNPERFKHQYKATDYGPYRLQS